MLFNEKKFIKEVINDYLNSDNQDYSIIYDNHYNNLIKTYDIKDIFQLYINEIDLEDSKYRYGNDYIDIKLNLILYSRLINYISDKKIKFLDI
jgi:hypothetical protein